MNPIEAKQQKVNAWLRYHPDWQVTIHLNSLYGCVQVQVEHGGKCVQSWIGNTLEKRMDEVMGYLGIEREQKQ